MEHRSLRCDPDAESEIPIHDLPAFASESMAGNTTVGKTGKKGKKGGTDATSDTEGLQVHVAPHLSSHARRLTTTGDLAEIPEVPSGDCLQLDHRQYLASVRQWNAVRFSQRRATFHCLGIRRRRSLHPHSRPITRRNGFNHPLRGCPISMDCDILPQIPPGAIIQFHTGLADSLGVDSVHNASAVLHSVPNPRSRLTQPRDLFDV